MDGYDEENMRFFKSIQTRLQKIQQLCVLPHEFV